MAFLGKNFREIVPLLGAVRTGFVQVIVATRGLSVALMNIPVIGWIAAAVTAIVVAVKLLWNNCKSFREVLYGVWELAKVVFAHIGDFFSWLWNHIVKPVGEWIWEHLTSIFTQIWQTGVAIWNWLKETFGGFFSFLEQSTIQPIYNAFSRIWDWITDLFHKLMAKVKEFVQPIIDLWDKLFSSEGMKSVTVAYQEGTRKGAESYDNDHKKDDKPQEVTVVEDKNAFDLSKNKPSVPTVGGVAAAKTMNSTGVGGDKGKSENKVRNLSIGKMMDNFNVYMNTEKGIDKQQLLQAVTEILRTAAVDFASSND